MPIEYRDGQAYFRMAKYADPVAEEREAIVRWLRTSADQIIGNILTGEYDTKACEMAALAIEIAAKDIEAGEHLK